MARGKNQSTGPVIGIDVGGTKVLAGVVDADWKILGLAKKATKGEAGVEAVVERIVRVARDAAREAGLALSDVVGICSAAPGALNPEEGTVRHAPNLPGWEDVPFAKLLSNALGGVPVFIENDGNLGTLGEHVLGAAVGYRDVVGYWVGTGLGGGLILDGKLWQGAHKTAAEIGHTIVLADGPVCGCGRRGCLESVASRTALERDIWAGIRAGRESIVPEIMARTGRDRLTSGVLAEAYEKRDPLVYEVISRMQYYLGLSVASAINFIDPEVVVIGGGVAEALGEAYLEPIRRVAYQYTLNKRDARSIQIVGTKLGDHAVVYGAAVYARQRLER